MNWLDAVDVVSLDAGGTLLEPWPSVGEVYARAAEAAGFGPFAAAGLQDAFVGAWRARGDFDYSRTAWARLVRAAFGPFTAEAASPELFEAAYTAFAQPGAWRVFPDVPPFLDAARRRELRLIVVSNWDERLVPLLDRLGLGARFEFVLPSVDAGVPKPHPGIFARARARCGVEPGRVLHVGDGWDEDVEGAASAGWRAAWLDRTGKDPGRPGRIASLVDLLDGAD